MEDMAEALKANPVAKLLTQIEQNTRSERTAVLYKSRQELGANKVRVKVRANVYAITDIDNVKQEFTANLAIRARWKEPLLQDKSEKSEIDWDDQWNPRIELENSASIRNFDRKYELRYFHTDTYDRIPHVCLTMSISATFKEMFELDEFPVDYQALNIWLISEWPFSQLELVKDDEYMDHLSVNTFTESKEWYLYPQLIGEPVGEPEEINEVVGSTAQFPLYTVTAHVKRLHQYYLWNHVLYMFLIFMVALSTFSIHPAQVGERIMGAILILLSALIYRLHMQPSLPVIAYWTALDKYNMAIMCCHILIVMEHAIIGKIATSGTDNILSIDNACLGAIIAIMMAVHCYFVAFFVQTLGKRDKFLHEETDNFNELNKEILDRYEERVRSGKWKYEPPPTNGATRDRNSSGLTAQTALDTPRSHHHIGNGQPSPRPQRANPMTRSDSQRQSGRGRQPPAQLPPLPSAPTAHLPANRYPGRDMMNPTEATHEVKIPMPADVQEAVRSRSRSNSRSRSRTKRSHRSNRVASELEQTSDDE